ncbi:hypothetical protein [Jeotgalibacillus proteolyticus]|uniref:Uncharacterized protein n=1 Tax=Jeotgalibacillus proteolyticus TaxID=2082395 RepID=A0A2S5GFW8_9BACL|nr:hypothetical protein [Jeotgalibacillus proteolyticus]PPA71804.1 hypothetical protein C4B60_00020 [Jeotgalibacillus proteolyticus]
MQLAQEIANSQAVWTLCCIFLAATVIREMRKENIEREKELKESNAITRAEAQRREERLLNHLDRSNDIQQQTSNALQSIQKTMITIESRVDRVEKRIYRKREDQ